MSESGYVITCRDMTVEQLAKIETQACLRFYRMRAVTENMGNLTLAVAALVIEIIEEAQPDNNTMVFIVAQEDLLSIIRSYLRRHKLSTSFPYKNGALLDYVSYADFSRVAACFG
jgi:hypothetical protein